MRLLIVVALLAAPAIAYRPPASAVIDLMVAKQFERGVKTLNIAVETTEAGATIVERVVMTAPATVTITTAEGRRTEKPKPDLFLDAVLAGPPFNAAQAEQRLSKDLEVLGIDVDVVSYTRVDGRVAYLIGAKSWETDKPSVAIDKESLVVLRVRTTVKGDKLESRYLGWGSSVGGNWYPLTIESYKNGALIRRTVTQSVERNVVAASAPAP
jgi:hypothetical protein